AGSALPLLAATVGANLATGGSGGNGGTGGSVSAFFGSTALGGNGGNGGAGGNAQGGGFYSTSAAVQLASNLLSGNQAQGGNAGSGGGEGHAQAPTSTGGNGGAGGVGGDAPAGTFDSTADTSVSTVDSISDSEPVGVMK